MMVQAEAGGLYVWGQVGLYSKALFINKYMNKQTNSLSQYVWAECIIYF